MGKTHKLCYLPLNVWILSVCMGQSLHGDLILSAPGKSDSHIQNVALERSVLASTRTLYDVVWGGETVVLNSPLDIVFSFPNATYFPSIPSWRCLLCGLHTPSPCSTGFQRQHLRTFWKISDCRHSAYCCTSKHVSPGFLIAQKQDFHILRTLRNRPILRSVDQYSSEASQLLTV